MTGWDDSRPYPWVEGSLTDEESGDIARRLAALVQGLEPDLDGRTPFDELVGSTPPVSTTAAGARVLTLVPPVARPVVAVDDLPDVAYAAADPSGRRSWHWIAAALVLVFAATVGVALAAGRSSPTDPVPTVADLAQAVGQRPDHALAVGEYWYQRTTTRSDLGLPDVVATTTESSQWTASDGTGRTAGHGVDQMTNGDLVDQADINSTRTYDVPGSLTFLGMSYEQFRSLPAEPQALLDQLVALDVTVEDGGAAYFAAIAAADAAPPAVRRAAVEALHLFGGVVTGTLTDPTGRVGTGVQGRGPEGPWMVILDPATGEPLAVYLGFPVSADGSADLGSATIVTVFGAQSFTYSTD